MRQLEPGSYLSIGRDGRPALQSYWTLREAVCRSRAAPFRGSLDDAVDALDEHLRQAVRQRMVADVPIGALLSGGYDSSTVIALMQAQADRPVRTFSIGFSEGDYNEAAHAGAVARHLGTDHTELTVTPEEARAVIPQLPGLYDEPFADSSQVPTLLVFKLARRHVTVALTGDGGDELFAGYNRYLQGDRIRQQIALLPQGARRVLAAGMRRANPDKLDRLFQLPARALAAAPDRRQAAQALRHHDRRRRCGLSQADEPVAGPRGRRDRRARDGMAAGAGRCRGTPRRVSERMQYLDTLSYLAGDILTKVDRASMAVSLEARAPLLDHRVLEFAWSLPLEYKISAGRGKWVMRQVLYRYVPPALVERAKSGFAIPVGSWLRGPLRDWAEDLLDEGRLRAGGLFNPAPIRARWEEHLAGRRNWQGALWSVLMFQAWQACACPTSDGRLHA